MKSIFITTPAFDGRVHIQYALALADTMTLLKANGYDVKTFITASGSLLVAERNRAVQQFWESGCDYLFCIDSDLGWPPEAALAMLQQDKEFICSVYPARGTQGKEFTFRPVCNSDGSIVREGHLLQMQYVPAGFMILKRSAIEKMHNKFPELYYSPKDPRNNPEPGYCLFDTEVWEGEFWGEDYVFCRRARDAGVEIWCDPLVEFDHAGDRGMMLQVITDAETKKPLLQRVA